MTERKPLALTLAGAWHKRGFAAIARSFRFHRPRGAFCHRGWCQQCRTTLPDGRIVLACTIPADASASPLRLDKLRPIGAIGERTRPWFYETRTPMGELQQLFMRTLRRLSAAPALPTASPASATRQATVTHTCDVLVVGGGPAGIAAANELARAGCDCVLVHSGRVDELPACKTLTNHLCVGLYDNPRAALCIGSDGNALVHFERLVVATGAYDRLPTVRGNDTPGVIGLRAFERLAGQDALRSDARVGIYGNEVEASRALDVVKRANVPLAFVAGPADVPETSGPRLPHVRLARIEGRARITGVAFESGARARCDLLVIGLSQASYELQAQNGCAIELDGDPPVVRPVGASLAPMLVVGEAAGWVDPRDVDARTRAAVGEWLADATATRASAPRTHATSSIDDAAFVCLCEDVRAGDIRAALTDGYGDVELVKRHTGAGTGPCQGKLCHAPLLACAAAHGAEVRIPTPRPLVRPITIARLAGSSDGHR